MSENGKIDLWNFEKMESIDSRNISKKLSLTICP